LALLYPGHALHVGQSNKPSLVYHRQSNKWSHNAAIATSSSFMATSVRQSPTVARGGSCTLRGGTEGHRSGPNNIGHMPLRNKAMHCRSRAPETKRCAVGQNETMCCRFAPIELGLDDFDGFV